MKIPKLISVFVTLILLAAGMACAEKAPVTRIDLSNSGITVNGEVAGNDPAAAVYTANDIVYYESGRDFTYGDGRDSDAHDPEIAAAHTVVHITKPGNYSLSGKLSKGQIAVDLGENAKDDPEAVVTLILNNAEITCEVAPAIIFYNVYECGSKDEETASKDVDTSAAGANIIIADGTQNGVAGSYVADIYDPGTVVIKDGEVKDAQKLHSYDGAVYSRMSMNISGGEEDDGIFSIIAENEGLCSEMHLTINGGRIGVWSGNDCINANEDNLSVVAVNGGLLRLTVTGETGEGDGIDSNGWIIINGGMVTAYACGSSMDSGIDADQGIHINGGDVTAFGNMLDHIEDGGQTYAVFSFAERQKGGEELTLADDKGTSWVYSPANDYSVMVYSSPLLEEGTYTIQSGGTRFAGSSGMMFVGGGMKAPKDVTEFENMPDFRDKPQPPEGMPEFDPEQDRKMPRKDKFGKGFGGNMMQEAGERKSEFEIRTGANLFSGIASEE